MATVLKDRVISATELNRKSGALLREAVRRPITVSRAGGDVVLLSREQAARSIQAEEQGKTLQEIMSNLMTRLVFKSKNVTLQYRWMNQFDNKDLSEFAGEYIEAFGQASNGLTDWNEVDALVHEWHQSAIALQDKQLVREWKRVQRAYRK